MSQQEELDGVAVYQPDWALWVRQLVAIGLVIGGVYAVTLLSPVFSLIIATFLLSFLTYFAARSLAAHSPFGYRVSVLLISALIAVALLAVLLAIVPSMTELFRGIVAGLYSQFEILKDSLVGWNPASGGYSIRILDTVSIDITPIASQIRAALIETDPQIAQQLARTAIVENMPPIDPVQILAALAAVVIEAIGASSGFFATLFLGLFLSLLILLELPSYGQRLMSSTPEDSLREILLIIQKIMNVWHRFFRGQLLVCAIIGVLTFIQLWLMGLSGALPLALLVATVSLIPTLGGIIALIPLAIVPFLQGSTVFTEMSNFTFALLVVGVNLIITQFIWLFVSPKIMGKAVSLPLPIVIVGVIIGGALGGILGAFLIVPLLGTLRVIVLFLIAKVLRRDPFPGETVTPTVGLAEL